MLNSNNERMLAYIEKIAWVKPIEGADNIELVGINGWTCIAKIGEFKPDDLCVYFEIDSKLPEAEWSKFMENKHYKVKTMKLGKFKVISQGLALPLSAFDCLNIEIPTKLHADCTKLLGVTYSVAEDNDRKANSVDKYKKMTQRHPKLFHMKSIQWVYAHSWGKKLLFAVFGKKADKRGGWPAWVTKTDEERCLVGDTKIQTDQGILRIADIVNKKLDVKVLSYNFDKNMFEYKPIVSCQKYNGDPKETKYSIKFPYKVGTSRVKHIKCTGDHKFYTPRGFIEAKDLTLQDKLYMVDNSFFKDPDILAVIYGILLGDGSIAQDKRNAGRVRIQTCHGTGQLDYLKYISNMFEEGKIINNGISGGGSVDKPIYKYYLATDPYLDINIKQDWLNNQEHKKHISQAVIDKLTPASLAFWYMDDGCISYRDGIEKAGHQPSIRLNTQGFSIEEVNMLIDMLINKFNIECNIRDDRGPIIYINVKSTPKFLELVTPYMCKSMAYKTLPSFEYLLETKKFSFKKESALLEIPILNIEIFNENRATYDLEIKDNHNFIAQGILTHNCQNMTWILTNKEPWIATEKIDGTSTTFTMKRHKIGKPEFYVCSRNVVFDRSDKKCFYDTNVYLEMAEKYKIYDVLLDIMTSKNLDWVTIQGETYGAGIQKRDYSKNDHDFMAFNLIYSDCGRLNTVDMKYTLDKYGIPSVPILNKNYILPDTLDELMNFSTGNSLVDGKPREGIVFRSMDGKTSFKCVSNSFLLKYHS